MKDREFSDRFEFCNSVGRSPEFNSAFFCKIRNCFEELENTGFTSLEFAEGLKIHEQIDNLLFSRS